ncbi:hypothetical protein D3C71_1688220 [compost metagenome]
MVDAARIYADGLQKFEPSDLGRIKIPIVSRLSENTLDVFKFVCDLAAAGRLEEAQSLADDWLKENSKPLDTPPARLQHRFAA